MLRSREGFLLIETLLAIVVVSICLTLIAGAYLAAYRATDVHAAQSRALLLMEDHLTRLTRYGFVIPGIPMEGCYDPPDERFCYQVNVVSRDNKLCILTLTILWRSGSQTRHLKTSTLLLNPASKDGQTKI